eukprot:COSAG04_NODE_887_length_9615_cov_16.346574_2_plen_236_part_00
MSRGGLSIFRSSLGDSFQGVGRWDASIDSSRAMIIVDLTAQQSGSVRSLFSGRYRCPHKRFNSARAAAVGARCSWHLPAQSLRSRGAAPALNPRGRPRHRRRRWAALGGARRRIREPLREGGAAQAPRVGEAFVRTTLCTSTAASRVCSARSRLQRLRPVTPGPRHNRRTACRSLHRLRQLFDWLCGAGFCLLSRTSAITPADIRGYSYSETCTESLLRLHSARGDPPRAPLDPE